MMDGAEASLYVFVGMGATGLVDMRASFKRRVWAMAVGISLAASIGLASASLVDGAEAPTPAEITGAVDASAYQRAMHFLFAEQYELALPYFVRANDEARSRAGHGSGEHATALNNLGELYRRMERYDEAEPLLREAIAIDESRLGPNHQSLANALNNLALVQRARGDYVEAERNQKRSLHILEDTLGRRHPSVAGSLNNLARLYETTGFPERAQPLLERALMIARGTLGEAHPTTKQIAANLDRVTGTLAGASPDNDSMAEAVRDVAEVPLLPQAALRLPPPADPPDPAASLAALAATESTVPADLESMAPAEPAPISAPPALSEPVVVEPASVFLAKEEVANDLGATVIEPAAAPSALNGVGNGTAEVPILPQARPVGMRWPRLLPGAYAMHLASVRSPVSATEEWQRLAGLFGLPEMVHQLEPQRIERGEGVFYRVLGGPFTTSAEAAAACAPVRAKGEYCGVIADGD